MADGVMDHIYNEDKNETYEIADAQARSAILELEGDVSALDSGKVDKIEGKGLSTEDYTYAEKQKLATIERASEVNNVWFGVVQSVDLIEIGDEHQSCYLDFYIDLINRNPRNEGVLGDRFYDGDLFVIFFNSIDTSQYRPREPYCITRFCLDETPTQVTEKHPYRVYGNYSVDDLLFYINSAATRTFVYRTPQNEDPELLICATRGSTDNTGEVRLTSSLNVNSDAYGATASAVKRLKDLIDSISGGGLSYDIVQSLPVVDISTSTIYLVPKQTAGTQNVYDEYINPTGTTAGWEKIGDTEIDLSNYYTKSETNALLADKADDVDIPYFASGTGLSLYQSQVGGGHTTYSYSIDSTVMAEINDIQNKADSSSLATVATSGDYDDLTNKPTIPAAQVNSDWNASSGVAQILNKPTLAQVATSGSASDVSYSGYATGNNVKDAIDDVALDLLDKQDTMIAGSNTTIRDGHIIDVGLREVKVDGVTRISASDSSPVLLKSGKGIEIDASTTDITFKSTIKQNNSTVNATTSTSGQWTTRAIISLSKGLWILVANCYWQSNATGYRHAVISPNLASETGGVCYMRTSATNGQVTNYSLSAIVSIERGTPTYYLNMYQNSGVPLTIGGSFTAVRLSD